MKLSINPSFFARALIAAGSLMLPYQALTQTFTTLHTFSALTDETNADGAYGYDTLVVSGNTLYGTADGGGGSSNGTVFAVNTDGTGFMVLHTFSPYAPNSPEFGSSINADGAHPYAGLILSGDTLYGTAIGGGSTGSGTIFALNTNGTSFRTVYSFTNGSDGAEPYGGLTLSGSTLYGTASYGGNGGFGTVFSVNTDGTGFATLYTFTNGSDGATPQGGVILVGNALYGMATSGGDWTNGTLFSVTTDGAVFNVLHTFSNLIYNHTTAFTNSDGAHPYDGLVSSGNILYGTASEGGSTGEGTVFSVHTDGTDFTPLHDFTALPAFFNEDGAIPYGGLFLSGDTLYGTAKLGGKYGFGTVFSLSTAGADFMTLYSLGLQNGTNGVWPVAGVVLSGNYLYGTTWFGGSANNGIVYSLSLTTIVVQQGSLKVTITPAAAVAAGAKWQVDDGTTNDSGATVSDLAVGSHIVSFLPAAGWTTPVNQTVTVRNGATTVAGGVYTALPPNSAVIVLRTNGEGTILHAAWPPELVIGKQYTVTASPKPGNLFSQWVGGTNRPYSILSTLATYTFTMQTNLQLTADFAPNPFIAEQGVFSGLYMDTNDVTEASSGFLTLSLTTTGAFTGKIMTSGSTYILPTTNKFNPSGQVQFTMPTKEGAVAFNLQLGIGNPASPQISGTVSNAAWMSGLTADRAVFNASTNKAVNYEGQYTLAIAKAADGSVRPGGEGWGTVSITSAGQITLNGSLADGAIISQSSVSVTKDGRWPFYAAYPLPPAGNGGAVFSWITFSNQPATTLGGTMYWFRPAGKTPVVYQDGFTNRSAISGSAYSPTNRPLLALTNGQVTLSGGNLPFTIANQIDLTVENAITVAANPQDTNKLALTINKATGSISGSFANPSSPRESIRVSGVLLQNQTNAVGYFLGTNQSGAFALDPL